MKVVDARGLSCPEPVLVTLEALKETKEGEMEILVDTDTSKENVIRAVSTAGWEVVEILEEDGYKIKVKK